MRGGGCTTTATFQVERKVYQVNDTIGQNSPIKIDYYIEFKKLFYIQNDKNDLNNGLV